MTEADVRVPIAVRGLNEWAYCPRLYHLMYVQGLFDDSADTVEGTAQHERRRARKKQDAADDDAPEEVPWPKEQTKELTLSDDGLGLVGKFDVLIEKGDQIVPIEDKHGTPPDAGRPITLGGFTLCDGIWSNDQIQVAGQMALLRANGYRCEGARVYYRKTKTLMEIPWSEALSNALGWCVSEARKLHDTPAPDPLNDSPKCIRCSLNHICLPDETLMLRGELEEPRRLHPGRDEAGVLYLTTPGARLSKSGDSLNILLPSGAADTVPRKDVAHVCILGNGQVTTQALLDITEHNGTVAYLSSGGWLRTVATAPLTKNVALRKAQFTRLSNENDTLPLARSLVAAKISNQRTLLRRNRVDDVGDIA